MLVAGLNELLYVIAQWLFVILARRNATEKTHITHLDITLFTT
jgi:hypothetical protein